MPPYRIPKSTLYHDPHSHFTCVHTQFWGKQRVAMIRDRGNQGPNLTCNKTETTLVLIILGFCIGTWVTWLTVALSFIL